MKRLRALVVTRRYWPHCDDGCHRLFSLVGGLQRQGVIVNVLAPRYERHWPVEMRHRETLVLRPLVAPRNDWALGRYLRQLAKWMIEYIPSYDLVYCDAMREEASVLVPSAKQFSVPSVVRCSHFLGENDTQWQARCRSYRSAFDKCCQADAIIAPRASLQQTLLASGVSPTRIVRIGQGIGAPVNVTDQSRKAARKSLASIHADLRVPPLGRVILCATRMAQPGHVCDFVAAVGPLMQRNPNDRLWLIGDGPHRSKIFQQLRGDDLTRCVLMPGSFDHAEDLMHAADVFVLPSALDGADWFWPLAIAAGLPSVVADCPDTRSFAGAAFSMMPSFPIQSPGDAVAVLQQVLDDLEQANALAIQLRQPLTLAMPQTQFIDRHVQLFHRLTEQRNMDSRPGAIG